MPFVRSSFVLAATLSMLRLNFTFASAVASCTIASGSLSSTASRTAPASSRSSITGFAPSARRRSALRRRVVGTDHIMPRIDQLRDEPAARLLRSLR